MYIYAMYMLFMLYIYYIHINIYKYICIYIYISCLYQFTTLSLHYCSIYCKIFLQPLNARDSKKLSISYTNHMVY